LTAATVSRTAQGEVLVVGPESVARAVGACLPDRAGVRRAEDLFAALEELAQRQMGSALIWGGALPSRPASALNAARGFLAGSAKLLILARPEAEPLAKSLLDVGADDYLIWPLRAEELRAALDLRVPAKRIAAQPRAADVQSVAGALNQVADAICAAASDPATFLDRVAAVAAQCLHARFSTVELPDALSVCGDAIGEPVLHAEIALPGGRRGALAVGPRRSGSYGAEEIRLLEGLAAVVGSVWELCGTIRQWQERALTDDLTGLPNRRGLLARLREILEHARLRRNTVTLLMFDIDDFKRYNDQYGHPAGDAILRDAGKLFRRYCRKHDVVARLGGDEFVVVFWEPDEPRVAGSKPPRDVLDVVDRFRRALERHEFERLGPDAQGSLTISGGLVTYPWDASDAHGLLSKADQALLLAKQQGKNRIWLIGQGGC